MSFLQQKLSRFCAATDASPNQASVQSLGTATTMFLIRNYVPNSTTTPPAPTAAPTAPTPAPTPAPIASTIYQMKTIHLVLSRKIPTVGRLKMQIRFSCLLSVDKRMSQSFIWDAITSQALSSL